MILRLIRPVSSPGRTGPCNGQFALQRALRRRGLPWLRIGGRPREDEMPWFWSWADRELAAFWARIGRPFIAGPNILFADSRRPCGLAAERDICAAASCRLLFTESDWYRQLIERHRGPANRAPLVVWPYPIEPPPGGPLPAEYDVAIYEKSGVDGRVVERLCRAWPRHVLVRYGHYRREEWYAIARRSRCCMYFSDDDRGPLALAEAMLAGCPAVGLPRGAPWIDPGRTGVLLDRFEPGACIEAVRQCHRLDRAAVATVAGERFGAEGVVDGLATALAAICGRLSTADIAVPGSSFGQQKAYNQTDIHLRFAPTEVLARSRS